MRYAIVSDLHANARAWNAVLADLYEQGADLVVCLGDVVGYGPNPAEVLESVRSVTENCVMGNHDAAAAGIMDYSIFNDHARQAIEWTMTVLSPEAKSDLSSTPLAIDAGEILFVHAEVAVPGRFGYISDVKIARENFAASDHFVTFVGHTHLPKIFEQNARGRVRELPDEDTRLDESRRYLVNVGSVGEPRNPGDLRARYVIYDDLTRVVTFRRVEFDIVAYRHDLEATTLALRPFFLQVYEQAIEGRGRVAAEGGSLIDMQVGHDAEALVNSGRVANLAHLRNSGGLSDRARPSRAPVLLLVAAAVLALSFLASWLFFGEDSPAAPAVVVVETSAPPPTPQTVPPKSPEEESAPPIPPRERAPIADGPFQEPVLPEPATKLPMTVPTESAPSEADPVTPQKDPSRPVETAWWRMGEASITGGRLRDQQGRIELSALQEGQVIKPLAPDPVPATGTRNPSALQLGIWQEDEPQDHFALTADHSFTVEGWVMLAPIRRPVFLFGTRTGESDGRGWHLDLRPGGRGRRGEAIAFFYDPGEDPTQAIAEGLKIADEKAHHVALVWDHDASNEAGLMKVFLDGIRVAAGSLRHSKITGRQVHPFRIGASFNPPRLALDELRFTRRSLEPHEFLRRAPVTGVTMIQSDGRVTDSWNVPANWKDRQMPQPSDNVIIGPGVKSQIHHDRPTPFSGSLVLREEARLHLWSGQSEIVIPTREARLIMHRGAQLVLRSAGESKLGPIELLERAHIFGGLSSSGHHRTRRFVSEISGSGELILNGVNNNTFTFECPNRFTGGLTTRSVNQQTFKLICRSDGAFGSGPVRIEHHASLWIPAGLENVIADDADLILTGPKGTLASKLVLDSDERVARFVINNDDQGEGNFSGKTHPGVISGEGQLIVEKPSQ